MLILAGICKDKNLIKRRENKLTALVEKIFTFLDQKHVKLMAHYQSLRLFVTKDTKTYWTATHFLAKKKITAEKKYCVFRLVFPSFALFAAANAYIFMYEWALSKGFIPIMDMEYMYSFRQGRIGEDNKWEYCFQQPINAKEVDKQNYVIVRRVGLRKNSLLKRTCMDINGKEDDMYIHVTENDWRKYYANINKYVKKCWVFKQEILDDFEKEYGTQMRKAQNILGVFLRENFSEDYYKYLSDTEKKIYDNHPRVPDINTTIGIIKEYMQKWKCDYIFLSTVFQDSVERAREEFGDKIITIDRLRYKNILDPVTSRPHFDATEEEIYQNEIQHDYKEMLVSYTKEIIGLSRCNYLIAAKGNGASAALSINGGKYKDIHILEDENESAMY